MTHTLLHARTCARPQEQARTPIHADWLAHGPWGKAHKRRGAHIMQSSRTNISAANANNICALHAHKYEKTYFHIRAHANTLALHVRLCSQECAQRAHACANLGARWHSGAQHAHHACPSCMPIMRTMRALTYVVQHMHLHADAHTHAHRPVLRYFKLQVHANTHGRICTNACCRFCKESHAQKALHPRTPACPHAHTHTATPGISARLIPFMSHTI